MIHTTKYSETKFYLRKFNRSLEIEKKTVNTFGLSGSARPKVFYIHSMIACMVEFLNILQVHIVIFQESWNLTESTDLSAVLYKGTFDVVTFCVC